jgi:microcystin-dependent protein
MAYNGSGTFVRVHNFATDKTNLVPVTASRMDSEIDGIATGLSTALCKDGQTVASARIPFASGASAMAGAVGGTSYSFTNDPNTGVYSPAADQIGLVAGGVAVITSTATDVTVPVNLIVTGTLTHTGLAAGLGNTPVGSIIDYAGTSAPTGWLLCYGQAVSRTTYSALFAIIDEIYGEGDNSTTFNLPDLRGRVTAGQDDMGGSSANRLTGVTGSVNGDTLAAAGGEEEHLITEAELPEHSHPGTTNNEVADHTHSFARDTASVASGVNHTVYVTSGTSVTVTTGVESDSHGHAFTTGLTGSTDPHNNVQPTIILNKIIFTGVA